MNVQFDAMADFVLRQDAGSIPKDALDYAALMMLDTMGIAIAGMDMDAGVIARGTANALYASNDPEMSARMMFDGRTVSLAGAAFAAATAIDNLDGHDGYAPVKGHIGVAVLPTLVTLMQQCPEMSGPDALAHVAVAYEVAGRAGLSLHGTVEDYHTSGAWNALGVAAMAARMRGLSKSQLRQALGIAEYHGPRSQMMREIANPTMLHDGSGMGAFVGISAAIMAEQGFTGAPAITVESEQTSVYWSDLGQDWLVTRQYVKPYPICRWAHGAIDATRKVMQNRDLQPEQIETIEVRTFREGVALFQGIPDTTSRAQYSLPFAVAAYVLNGRIGVEQISGEGLSDARVHEMVSRIRVCESNDHNARFPAQRTADVTVTLTDGTKLESGLVDARGGSDTPFSRAEIVEKYDSFAEQFAGRNRSRDIKDVLMGLTDPNSRLSDLNNLIFEPL